MTLTLSLGAWIIPAAVTLGGLLWATTPRPSERDSGGLFGPAERIFGVTARLLVAIVIALAAWLIFVTWPR